MMMMCCDLFLFDVYVLSYSIDEFSRVCNTHDRLWMLRESMDFLGLQIE
jgi:hypothetical protein